MSRAPGGWTRVTPVGSDHVRPRGAATGHRPGLRGGPVAEAEIVRATLLVAGTQRLNIPVRARPRPLPAPAWPVDLVRQIVLFCGAYWLYRLVRGLVDGRAAEAFDNAREVIHIESGLGPVLRAERATRGRRRTRSSSDFASWMYVNSHFAITTVTLAWIYLRRNERFYFVRNMFMVAMGIALVGYMALPTAPPRMHARVGLHRLGAGVHRRRPRHRLDRRAVQPVRGDPVDARRVLADARRDDGADGAPPLGQALWYAYSPVVTFVVIATANHWWLDGFLGAAVAAVSAVAATGCSPARGQRCGRGTLPPRHQALRRARAAPHSLSPAMSSPGRAPAPPRRASTRR